MRLDATVRYDRVVGVGGIGTGMFLAVEGDATIGRTESRAAHLLDARDSCKLHDVVHHVATLLGAEPSGRPSFHVVPVGVVGGDDAGERLVGEMSDAGIDVTRIRVDTARPTLFSVCFQYPGGDGGNLTTADSAAATLTVEDVERVAPLLDDRTIALAQPEVPMDPRRRLLELAGDAGSLRAASFTSLELDEARSTGMFELVDLVTVNRGEAATIAHHGVDTEHPERFLRTVAAAFGAPRRPVRVVVTVGGGGAYAIEGGHWAHRPAPAVEVVSSAGSGDALLAGILVALVAGAPFLGDAAWPVIDDAVGLGVLLGSLNATSPHTIHPEATVDQLEELADRSGIRFGMTLRKLFHGEEV